MCLCVVLLLKGMNSIQLMDYINDRLIDHYKEPKNVIQDFGTLIMSSNDAVRAGLSYCLGDLKLVLF